MFLMTASMAAIETCMKKASGGKLADFSEQQILDCGYGKNGARGCNGAGTQSYIKYVADNAASWKFTHESTYPYKNKNPSLTCPSSSVAKPYNTGAKDRFHLIHNGKIIFNPIYILVSI